MLILRSVHLNSFYNSVNVSLCNANLCIIFVVGQCGNQIGGAFWPLALQEHGVASSKSVIQHYRPRCNDAFHSFFSSPTDISGESFRSISDLESAKVKARVSFAGFKTSDEKFCEDICIQTSVLFRQSSLIWKIVL